MRWKLLITAALAAAAVGAGAVIAVASFAGGPAHDLGEPGAAAAAGLLVPIGSIIFASVFVYRHTARRRTVQAAATALLAGILTLATLLAGSLLSRGRPVETAPTPAPSVSGS